MQVLKEDIKLKIINTAKEEFFNKGYKNTSMRTISKKSNVGLSNIYNYFLSKDNILKEVLSKLLHAIESQFKKHHSTESLSLNIFNDSEYIKSHRNDITYMIKEYKKEFKLLLFHCYGSSFENFRESYTEWSTKEGLSYLKKINELHHNKKINTEVSPFFIRTMSSWWLTTIGEIVLDDDLSDESIDKFITEYMVFATAGWKKLIDA